MSKKKRKHSQYAADDATNLTAGAHNTAGVGSTLAHLQGPPQDSRGSHDHRNQAEDGNEDTWTVIGKGGKKRKTNNYPGLVYADLHKQNSSIKISDLQSLLLYCIASGTSPQWVSVKHHLGVKKAVVLFVPGLERGMFDGDIMLKVSSNTLQYGALGGKAASPNKEEASQSVISSVAVPQADVTPQTSTSPDTFLPVRLAVDSLPEPLKPLAECFEHLWPVKAPGDDKYAKVFSPLHHMLNAQIPKSHEERDAEKAKKGAKSVTNQGWQNKRTPIKDFILSKDELRENDYVLHPAYCDTEAERAAESKRREDAKQTRTYGWVDSNITDLEAGDVPDQEVEQGSLTAGRTVFAMDCEMCKVDGDNPALTRISLIDWNGEVVMDELVKPDQPIIDYLTPFSGITAKKLDPITTTLADIQKRLLDILTPRTILVGHSLDSDLAALKLTHPFIIDTSILYQHPRGPPLKSSLKWLAQKYLHREIQRGHGTLGHDSVEDSRACLDLVKMKCEKGPEWGNSASTTETIFKRLSRTPRAGNATVDDGGQGKTGVIVDTGALDKSFGQMATFSIRCNTDTEVVEGVKRAVFGDPDGAVIPGGGVDFTWARMREVETLRGWKNNHRYDQIQMEGPSTTNIDVEPSVSDLAEMVTNAVSRIREVHASLPPCTLLVVYTGTGDPRDLAQLQQMQRTFKQEYKVKKWDELSVRWTDTEEQALKRACRKARQGLGFITIT
ncbi:MAG: hypothetical protein Q9184_001676 [Pyrenodesmia sp. 2 TL-2023]